MSNKKLYKDTFDTYYDSAIEDIDISSLKYNKMKARKFPKLAFALTSFLLVFLGGTAVAAAAGWINLSSIFNNIFNDPVSGGIVESGLVQELNITKENEDFTLELSAFTGDMETPVVLFELTPKNDVYSFNNIELLGQQLLPVDLENLDSFDFPVDELSGVYDEDENTYYFSYRLGSYLDNDYSDEIILRILGAKLHDGTNLVKADFNMDFSFIADTSILEKPHSIDVNQLFTKEVYETISFIDEDDYHNSHLHTGEINASTEEKTIKITDIQVSNYKTSLEGYIIDDDQFFDLGTLTNPASVRNQFVIPRFVTNHYWNGLDDDSAYEMAIVDNSQRIRLFVDDEEMAFHEETIKYYPLDSNEDDLYPVYMEFEGFNYDNAKKIEIHFGDEVIPIR